MIATLAAVGNLLTKIAKARKLGKKTITYLGTDEKLPWMVGSKKPEREKNK